MYIYIILLIFCIIIFCILLCATKPKKKNEVKKLHKSQKVYLKSSSVEDPYYLTWKYNGHDGHRLKLVPYHNKSGEFIIHAKDAKYLKQFYAPYGLYNQYLDGILNNITFVTPSFPVNPIQYLELIQYDDETYILKKNIFAQYDANHYLHIDHKNSIYFLPTIEEEIGKFVLEFK